MTPSDIVSSTGKAFDIVHGGEDISLSTLRQRCLTPTNIAKLLDVHPFSSKLSLFRAKTGERSHATCSDRMRGISLEAEAIATFEKKAGIRTYHLSQHFRHPRFHRFVASPDGVTADGALVEIKCPRKRHFWIPQHHELQMRWDAWILNAPKSFYVQYVNGEIFVEELIRDDRIVLDNLHLFIEFMDTVESIVDTFN